MTDLISEMRVLQSAAGYYCGEQYWDADFEAWLPYDRLSGYFASAEAAAKYIPGYTVMDTESDAELEMCDHYFANQERFYELVGNY